VDHSGFEDLPPSVQAAAHPMAQCQVLLSHRRDGSVGERRRRRRSPGVLANSTVSARMASAHQEPWPQTQVGDSPARGRRHVRRPLQGERPLGQRTPRPLRGPCLQQAHDHEGWPKLDHIGRLQKREGNAGSSPADVNGSRATAFPHQHESAQVRQFTPARLSRPPTVSEPVATGFGIGADKRRAASPVAGPRRLTRDERPLGGWVPRQRCCSARLGCRR
jgi:hypothetical protein